MACIGVGGIDDRAVDGGDGGGDSLCVVCDD